MKKPEIKPYVFQGYDFTELAEAWGYPCERYTEAYQIRQIKKIMCNAVFTKDKKIIQDVRNFVKAIGKYKNNYSSPLWKGLCNIKHDETFIHYVFPLLEYMWN